MPADTNANDTPARGYGKPPRRTQFKQGQSGNPKGRPKGTPNFVTVFEEALNESVVVNEGGHRKTIGKTFAIMKQMVNKAVQGDARATQQVLKVLALPESDRSEAKLSPLTLTEADEQVMEHLVMRIRAMNPTPGGTEDDTLP